MIRTICESPYSSLMLFGEGIFSRYLVQIMFKSRLHSDHSSKPSNLTALGMSLVCQQYLHTIYKLLKGIQEYSAELISLNVELLHQVGWKCDLPSFKRLKNKHVDAFL